MINNIINKVVTKFIRLSISLNNRYLAITNIDNSVNDFLKNYINLSDAVLQNSRV